MTKELSELVEKARRIEMTPEQQTEQRRSFAYGNTYIENERITRELIADEDRKLAEALLGGRLADQLLQAVREAEVGASA